MLETEIEEVGEDAEAVEKSRRQAFLLSLLSKRKEAVTGRAGSGIEAEWVEDEEHYQGIDDANRRYVASAASTAKHWATTGRSYDSSAPTRSVVFVNITRPYVDAACARVSDMLMPTDDRCWELKTTPIPQITPMDVQMLGGPEQAEQIIQQQIEQATQSCALMQREIDDCLVESNWHGEVRSMIEDAGRIGSGVLKGPYPVMREARMYRKGVDGFAEFMKVQEIKPGTKRIDPWNFYPDPSCGENIHNGSYVFEREYISAKQLADMVNMPGCDRLEIIAALKEGPKNDSAREAGDGTFRANDSQFEMWIFYGQCDADDLASYGIDVEDDDLLRVPTMAVIVNDRLIKLALNVLETGDFPYDVLAWQRRPGMPWGFGVSRHIRTAQRMLNGAARAMMDNSGLAASPQIIIGNGVTPADGQYNLRGGKIWRVESDASNQDARTAFNAFVTPSVQSEMMNIINWAMKIAEDTTGLPSMLQGIRGDAPDTLGGMQMQNNNATSVLRRLAKRFDDYITEPHIRRYYDWMMQHSDKDDIKGDFQVDVRASSALVERDAQQHFLMSLLQAAANPVYELDPAKLARELVKGQRLDPKTVVMDADKIAAMRKTNPVEQAKAGLIQAQTLKTQAEAATKGVEGMYSATMAGREIAIAPQIAPLADQIYKSAGGVDHDAAPAIPEPAAPIPSPQPESNTDPLTPANPDRGMMAGIEGGE